jgi:hypothetical protein
MKILILMILLATAGSSDIKIMISDKNKNKLVEVTADELASVYLKKTNSIRGIHVIPIDNKASYKEFYRKVVKKTPKQLHAYWTRQIYKGNKQPPKKMSRAQIKKAMKKNPKIISYTENKSTGDILISIR